MPDVTTRGLRFHVHTRNETRGEATAAADPPVVVFVHGLITDDLSRFHHTLAGPVAAVGAHLVLDDLRGHGRSERPESGYGAADLVADLVADLFALFDVLGHRRPVHLLDVLLMWLARLTGTMIPAARASAANVLEGASP
jgi:alpha-beta hydrolase superfamily lysophospholipase